MGRGGRRQRTLIHGMAILGLVQKPLVFSTSTPAAVGTEHDGLRVFHVALQVNNSALIQQRCEIDISYDQDRKKLSTGLNAVGSFRNKVLQRRISMTTKI